jgi:site-specific recombinase XerC
MASRLDDLARSFARHLKAEGRADRTLVIYGQAITFYAAWLAAQDRPATVDELTRAGIREWLATLLDAGQEPSTVATRYRSLRRFCGWLVDEGELGAHPMAGLEMPKQVERPVPIVGDADLAKLIKACTGKAFEDRRDEAMIRVLLDAGVRVSELCALTVEGTDLDAAAATVRGKGAKVRAVYFSAKTVRALDRYLRLRAGHRHAAAPALWLSQRGAMSPDGVRARLDVRATAAGLGHLHPHQFRHTNAHDFLINGGQERDLKRLMGWSSDAMLERYGASAADARAASAARRMQRGDRV